MQQETPKRRTTCVSWDYPDKPNLRLAVIINRFGLSIALMRNLG